MDKRGFIKTIEVVLAAIITTMLLLYIVPQYTGAARSNKGYKVLEYLRHDEDFRDFVIGTNGCFNSTGDAIINHKVEEYLPVAYNYVVCVNSKQSDLPAEKIYVDTVYISSNLTVYRPKVVRLYHWIAG